MTVTPRKGYEEWLSGGLDAARREANASSRARYQRMLGSVRDRRTRAAVLLLLADLVRVEAIIGDAAALVAERERLLVEAASLYPYEGVERALADARMDAAIMGAVAASSEVRALWEPRRRTHGWMLLVPLITEASPAARDALRRQPQLAAVRPVVERELKESGRLGHWAVARALGDAAMEERAAQAMRGSTALVRAQVAALLRPEVPHAKETLALIQELVAP